MKNRCKQERKIQKTMRKTSFFIAILTTMVALIGTNVSAQALPPIDLLTDADFQIDGAAAYDTAGYSVSDAGDVNGDGVDDVIVGAPNVVNFGLVSDSVYVVFGNSTTGDIDLAQVGAPGNTEGFRINGVVSNGWIGLAVSGAGDVNGDGLDDVIVGAPFADYNGDGSGSAYVISGKSNNSDTVNLANVGTPGNTEGFRIDGAGVGEAGWSVSDAGDVDGDGLDDVIIGAHIAHNNDREESGSAHVVFGKSDNTDTVDLTRILEPGNEESFRIDGAAMEDQAGTSVSGAGDVDRDGTDDVIVGAYRADNNGWRSGSTYVIFANPETRILDLANVGTPGNRDGFRIDGAAPRDIAGISVSGVGDMNGDDAPDLIVGATGADNGGEGSGSAYVVFGKPTTGTIYLSQFGEPGSTEGFRIDGAAAEDRAGSSVSGAGDVDGDGLDDAIVGAPDADNNGRIVSGSANVVFGKSGNDTVDLANFEESDNPEGFRIDGAAALDRAGGSVSGAGDVDGDGCHEVIVGAPYADNNSRSYSGSAYIVSDPECTSIKVDPSCDGDPYDNDFWIHDFAVDTPDSSLSKRFSSLTVGLLICGTELDRTDSGTETLVDHIDIKKPPGSMMKNTHLDDHDRDTGPIRIGDYVGTLAGRVATHDENGGPTFFETSATLRVDVLAQRELGDTSDPPQDSCNYQAENQVGGNVSRGKIVACFRASSDPDSPTWWSSQIWVTKDRYRRYHLTMGRVITRSNSLYKPGGFTKVDELMICGYVVRAGYIDCGDSSSIGLHLTGYPSAPNCSNGNGIFEVIATRRNGEVTPGGRAPHIFDCVEWDNGYRSGRRSGRRDKSSGGKRLPAKKGKPIAPMTLMGGRLGEGLIGGG